MKSIFGAIGRFFLNLYVWTYVVLDTVIVTFLIALTKPFDSNHQIGWRLANFWGSSIVRINPFWKIKMSGTYHIKRRKSYVLVANHASLGDIVCLYMLGRHFKWLAKDSLFKIPVFGWALWLLDYIPLERGKHGSIRDSFDLAQQNLDQNISVLIFPEGTRSKSGHLSPFKNGAFKLALMAQKPIIPIVIKGTSQALTKGRMSMAARVNGSVKVLAPVDTTKFGPDDHVKLRDEVWKLMKQEMEA